MVRQQTWWQRLVAQGCACTAAAVLGLLALVTPPSAAVLSVTGQGGAVPDGNGMGVTFDITIPPNSGTIASSGNNVTLSLIGFTHPFAFDLTFTLEHVGFGSAQFLLDRVLDSGSIVCGNNFIGGTYRFTSDATTTIQAICDLSSLADLPPGDYIPTLPDDATDSEMSSFWNGQDVSGTWRLFVADTDTIGVSNANWTWRLDITLAPDTDNDGVPDNEDECPNSDLSATVVIDGCDSAVPNTVFPSGCTISDLIAACAEDARNHGQFVSCVSHMTNDLKKAGTVTGQQHGAIQSCAAQADIP